MHTTKKLVNKIFLSSHRLSLGIFLLVFLLSLPGKIQASNIKQIDTNSSITVLEIFNLVNIDRTAAGLPGFILNQKLVDSAQSKATDMASKGYFAHNSPGKITPWYWFVQANYKFIYAGENLAVNFTNSADVNYAWMNSDNHRASILKTEFSETGIALSTGYYEGRLTTFVVQNFGQPTKI